VANLRLRPSQWTLLERLAAIDDRIEHNPGSGPIEIGIFNEGTFIVAPSVSEPQIDEADLHALESGGVLNVVSRTSSLIRLRVGQPGFDFLEERAREGKVPTPDSQARKYQADPPSGLRDESAAWSRIGNGLQQQGQPLLAVEAYRRAWELKLSRQPPGKRFHKGAELASMGSAYLQAGMMREAFRWFLAAFLEDSLSRAEDSPTIRDELHWPAAHYLRQAGLPEETLSRLSTRTRQKGKRRAIQDPMTLIVEDGLDDLIAKVRVSTGPAPASQVRVFVSSPGDLRRERLLVADVCQDLASILKRDVRALLWEGAGPKHPESPPFAAEVTGLEPQAVIDNQVRDALGGYDIYVGMIWLRMGTPTGSWRSGTEAEFRYALNGFQQEGRPRKLFFYTKRVTGSQERAPGVEDFIRELETRLGLPQRFRSVADLRQRLIHDLGDELRSM
jgi:tetratricopeptide (TPR) repeat protein